MSPPPNNKEQSFESRLRSGDWGEWPYLAILPDSGFPSGMERLMIAAQADILHFDPDYLPNPEKTNDPHISLGLPLLIGHLALGGSLYLVCREDERQKIITRLNQFTSSPEKLEWIKMCLRLSETRVKKQMEELSDKKPKPGSNQPGYDRLRKAITPENPELQRSGLNKQRVRLERYIDVVDKAIKAEGLRVGVWANREHPGHSTLRDHIINATVFSPIHKKFGHGLN